MVNLSKALREAAGPDTAYDPSKYQPGTLKSQCGPVSYTIQKLRGGDIMTAQVAGEQHLWNRLPSGTEIDFCSVDGQPQAKGRVRRPTKTINSRFLKFYKRFQEARNA